MNLPRPQFTNKTTPIQIARFLVTLIEAIEGAFAEVENENGE